MPPLLKCHYFFQTNLFKQSDQRHYVDSCSGYYRCRYNTYTPYQQNKNIMLNVWLLILQCLYQTPWAVGQGHKILQTISSQPQDGVRAVRVEQGCVYCCSHLGHLGVSDLKTTSSVNVRWPVKRDALYNAPFILLAEDTSAPIIRRR